MDFVRYAEQSVALLNAELESTDALVALLEGRAWLHAQVAERDVAALGRFQRELRPIFEASNADDADGVVEQLNVLLGRHPVTPYIAGPAGKWHLHVADRSSSVAELLVAETLMGLSMLVCDLGPTRLGTCGASQCHDVFVDTSPNQSRRYCSDRCSSRSNVTAYRARQRATAQRATVRGNTVQGASA